MDWNFWLDDQAYEEGCPARHAPEGFEVATSSKEALHLIAKKGLPKFIDFDHDLGGEDTAMVLLKELGRTRISNPLGVPMPPAYSVHSSNPVGRDNIHAYMETWFRVWKAEQE